MFTLEIDGRAIAVTDAAEPQAHELFESQDFKDDLLSLESEGRPLWNGKAALRVRASSEDEIDAFDEAMEDDDEEDAVPEADDEDDEEGVNVLFLVPIDDADDLDDEPARPTSA